MGGAEYVVVMRAASAARFREEDPSLAVTDWPTRAGPVRIEFRTRYMDEGTGARIPRDLWVDARGVANSLDEARDAYRDAAGVMGVLIAISANAAMRPPDVHLAFDNTPGLRERDYYSVALPEERKLPLPGRRVHPEATVALLAAVTSHPSGPRLHRAIAQYAHAIANWAPGLELLAVAHLFMGVDALTKIVLVDELQKTGLTSNKSLAQGWGIDVRQLDAEVRRRVIFQGDSTLQDEVSGISNAFEHGYGAIPELLSKAASARDKTAAYLRSAILKVSKMDPPSEGILLAPPYVEPQPMYPITAAIRGKLLGDASDLAAPGEQYPLLQWEPVVSRADKIESNQLKLTLDAKFSQVSLAEGVSFLPMSVEYHGPPSDAPADGSVTPTDEEGPK